MIKVIIGKRKIVVSKVVKVFVVLICVKSQNVTIKKEQREYYIVYDACKKVSGFWFMWKVHNDSDLVQNPDM